MPLEGERLQVRPFKLRCAIYREHTTADEIPSGFRGRFRDVLIVCIFAFKQNNKMLKYWGRIISGSCNQVAQWIVNHSKLRFAIFFCNDETCRIYILYTGNKYSFMVWNLLRSFFLLQWSNFKRSLVCSFWKRWSCKQR